MPKSLRQKLIEKGWQEEDINRTLDILFSEDKQEKHARYAHFSSPIIYWAGLLVAIIGNLLISVVFIPFLMILNSVQLYIIMGSMGAIFGAMFNLLLRDIEHVDAKHHVMAGVFIPSIALITVFVMVTLANTFNAIIKSPVQHNPYVISVIYVLAFSAPYAWYKWNDLREEKRHQKEVSLEQQSSEQQSGQLAQ
ncbi:hypothetical protein HZB03_00385 [Candidatus Woesearchaeota archaeon]|nr:hypothetical protein [Candidatus Woesearchaeota archaeon]